MGSKTNLSSTRRTVRELRQAQRLKGVDAALICLAETTVAALDDAKRADAPAYAVAKAATAHREALRFLLENALVAEPHDDFDAFMRTISTPTHERGVPED